MRQQTSGSGNTKKHNAHCAPCGVTRSHSIDFTNAYLLKCGFLLGLDMSAKFCVLQAFPVTVSLFDGGVLRFWDIRVCSLSGVIVRRELPYLIPRNQ